MAAAPPEVETHVDAVVLRPLGDLDVETAVSLREAAMDHVGNDLCGLVVDLAAVTYLDSAGLRVLFAIASRLEDHRQRLALVVPPGALMHRTLSVVGMETRASMHDTLDLALAHLRG